MSKTLTFPAGGYTCYINGLRLHYEAGAQTVPDEVYSLYKNSENAQVTNKNPKPIPENDEILYGDGMGGTQFSGKKSTSFLPSERKIADLALTGDITVAALVNALKGTTATTLSVGNHGHTAYQEKATIAEDSVTSAVELTPISEHEYVFTNAAITAVEIILPETIAAGFASTVSWHNPETPPTFTLTNTAEHTVGLIVNGTAAASYSPATSKKVYAKIVYNGDFVLITITEF